jgi:ribosome-binding protein aMBF1 (putative translation factor)
VSILLPRIASPGNNDELTLTLDVIVAEGTVSKAIDIHVGERIRSRREELQLTVAMLSRAAGCSEDDVRLIENGDMRPDADLLVRLAQTLRVKLSYFFEGCA